MGEQEEFCGSWPLASELLSSACCGRLGVNQRIEDLSISPSLYGIDFPVEINKSYPRKGWGRRRGSSQGLGPTGRRGLRHGVTDCSRISGRDQGIIVREEGILEAETEAMEQGECPYTQLLNKEQPDN